MDLWELYSDDDEEIIEYINRPRELFERADLFGMYSDDKLKLGPRALEETLLFAMYQYLMCQGTLVLSRHNSWSVFINRRVKRHIHWIFQLFGLIFINLGSIIMYKESWHKFQTAHGIFALCALITSWASLLNGLTIMTSHHLPQRFNSYWMKYTHYVTGIATLYFSAITLCFGFANRSFKRWTGNEDVHPYILMSFTIVFTTFVALDFIIVTKNKFILFNS